MWDQGWGKENPFGCAGSPWNKGGSGILRNLCWELCQEIFGILRNSCPGMVPGNLWNVLLHFMDPQTAGIGGWGWNPREIQLEFREYGEKREGMAQNESGVAQDRDGTGRDGTGQGWDRTGRAEAGSAGRCPLIPGKLPPLPLGIPLGCSQVKDSIAGSSCQVCREVLPPPIP